MKPAITHTQHQKMPTIVPHLTYRRYPAFVLSWVWHVLVILVWLKLLTQVYSSTVLPNVVPPTPSPRISNRELLVHPVTPNNIATNEGIRVCSAQKYILYNLYNVRYFPQIPTMDLGENQLNHLTWMCIQVTKCFFPIHITISPMKSSNWNIPWLTASSHWDPLQWLRVSAAAGVYPSKKWEIWPPGTSSNVVFGD